MKENLSGEILRRYRRSKGLTQGQLAKMSGLSTPTISMLEGGKHPGRPQTLKQLRTILEIPESIMLGGEVIAEKISVSKERIGTYDTITEVPPPTITSYTSNTDDQNMQFPIGLMIGNFHIEIDPSVKHDIRRLLYWSLSTGILTKLDVKELLDRTQI